MFNAPRCQLAQNRHYAHRLVLDIARHGVAAHPPGPIQKRGEVRSDTCACPPRFIPRSPPNPRYWTPLRQRRTRVARWLPRVLGRSHAGLFDPVQISLQVSNQIVSRQPSLERRVSQLSKFTHSVKMGCPLISKNLVR